MKKEKSAKAKQSLRRVAVPIEKNEPQGDEPMQRSKQSLRKVDKVKQREPLSAHLKHQVYLKNQGKCSYKNEKTVLPAVF